MSEVFFYHLERQAVDAVLPNLLERTLQRGWRAVVEAPGVERIEALDAHLWTYRDDSFLPHGRDDGPYVADQPVVLTTGNDAPNGAHVRFLIDGAGPSNIERYARVVVLFNGRDEEALAQARDQWKALKSTAYEMTYWQQDEAGRWQKKG